MDFLICPCIPVDGLMMRECPYSTKTREVLENPSSPPSRFPSGSGNLLATGCGFPDSSRVSVEGFQKERRGNYEQLLYIALNGIVLDRWQSWHHSAVYLTLALEHFANYQGWVPGPKLQYYYYYYNWVPGLPLSCGRCSPPALSLIDAPY